MSISIDAARCTGCGACTRVCPGGLIRLVGADAPAPHAEIARPSDCWGCTACVKACPVDAIAYFLGADMGGRGTRLFVHVTPRENVWTFARPDGTEERIVTDRTQGNRY